MKNCVRMELEALEDRTTPSHFGSLSPAAFAGLDVASARIVPGEPTRFAPVFALNYSPGSENFPALRGLQNAYARFLPGEPYIPPNPVHASPVFFGLGNGISVDGPL